MGRSLALLIPFVSLIAGAASASQGAETVWSGLVIAENVAQPQPIPPELTRIEGSLKKILWLQPVSGNRPVAKDSQDRTGRLARNQQIFWTACRFTG